MAAVEGSAFQYTSSMDVLSKSTNVMYCSCVSANFLTAAFTPPSTSLKPMMAGF